jgi:hypothetical protein
LYIHGVFPAISGASSVKNWHPPRAGREKGSEEGTVISIEWILYTGLLPVLAWRGEISLVAPNSKYIAASLSIKKISFPFSVHHSSYNTRRLSTKGESAISLMQ